jgi:hypothetical protein
LVVEIRAAKGAHEEVVSERVVLCPLPQLHVAAVEIAHRPAADVGDGGEHVVTAAVDLLDAVIVGVDRTDQDLVGLLVDRRAVDPERLVGQLGKIGIGLTFGVPYLQVRKDGSVVVTLDLLLGRCVGDTVGAGKQSVEMIETAVLGVDDHNGLDLRQIDRLSATRHGCCA